MMKTIFRRVLPYFAIIGLVFVIYSYSRDTRQDIKVEYGHKNMYEPFVVELNTYDNRYICNDCKMMVMGYKYTAQVVTKSGKAYLFDDIGCMINWIEDQNFKDGEYQAFVFTTDTKAYIPAELAWYIRDANTPVGYGFEAFEISMSAVASASMTSEIEGQVGAFRRKKGNSNIFEYFEIRDFCIRGETLLHPMIKRELLEKN